MSSFILIGKCLVPRDQIALVEPFDPNASPNLQTTREFRSRVILINRKRCPAPTFRSVTGCGVMPTHERSF
jgi:hypothetical protein